jgi:DNA-binding ferritin-like protein (Dps family)
MSSLWEKIGGVKSDKAFWRETERRAKALPADYRTVYAEVQKYIFATGLMDEHDVKGQIFRELVELFEDGAREGKTAHELVGDDVADFADNLGERPRDWLAQQREKLNKTVAKKLAK